MNTLTLNFTNNLARTDSLDLTNEILEQFYKQLDTSEATKRTYKKGIKVFLSWVRERKITLIDSETIKLFKVWCSYNKSTNTTNTYLTSIKALYNYLETKGFKNIAKTIKKAGTDTKNFSKDSLTREQVKQIVKSIDTSTIRGLRDKAIFLLLVNTGLRTCELVGANISDIGTKDNKSVLYVKGKGRTQKNEFVVLNNSCINAINDYLISRKAKAKDPLFTSLSDRNNGDRLTTRSIRNIVKGLYKGVGIVSDRLTTHSTRHTFVTLSLKSGSNLQEVQQRARHKSINTTLIYAHNLTLTESNAEQRLEEYINI